MNEPIASYDIDGVIFMGEYPGLTPRENDVIITGRSFEEIPETIAMLRSKGIMNYPFFNPLSFDKKSRLSSGTHKGNTINLLNSVFNMKIVIHYEDDPIQADEIERLCPNVKVVKIVHDLVTKENVRHK
jgi:hypothetical protein